MTKPTHILLVEDNEGDILLTTDALETGNTDYQISVAKDGWEAFQFLEKTSAYENVTTPDFILLDINLPKMNGHELLKKIRSNQHLKHIPVVIFTTSSSDKDIISAYQNYANSYITKPVELTEFLETIEAIKLFWLSVAKLPTKSNY